MKKRFLSAAVMFALCVSIAAGCASNGNDPESGTAATETSASSAENTTKQEKDEAPAETEETVSPFSRKTNIPEIDEDFSSGETTALPRGDSSLSIVDDEASKSGKALEISGRTASWNGANFPADAFRGNNIMITGSFRSANPSVKVTVQFSAGEIENYNGVFSVNTKEDKYSSGKGTFKVPENASDIYVYIESDNLEDIYCEKLTVKVQGAYINIPEPVKLAFVDTSGYPSLKELYKDDFKFGIAVTTDLILNKNYCDILSAQANSMTLGNSFKPDSILDRAENLSDPAKYNEAPAVKFDNVLRELDFAKESGMTVRGHTLVWHNQTPDWLFYKDYDVNGELADRETMLKRLESYIKSVVTWADENYPGLVSCWDVANECAADDSGMRKSLWYKTVGDDYVRKAFEFARKYAPEGTKLFYNDYNSYQSRKQQDIIKMITPIIEDGNIDGMGMQSHINTDINLDEYLKAMRKYAELGLEIHVTELDVVRKDKPGWEKVQGDYYYRLMQGLIKLRRDGVPLTSVTVWGITDTTSWISDGNPLLFNGDLSRKPAFDGVVRAAEEANGLPSSNPFDDIEKFYEENKDKTFEEISELYGAPGGHLSGFWGDIYLNSAGEQVIIYYDENGKVELVKCGDKTVPETQ